MCVGRVMADADPLHLPGDWARALDRIDAEGRSRIAVIGPADAGKSRFVGALLARRPELALIDLDPGQKMTGPPGTLSLARGGQLEHFVWIGTTSAAALGAIARGAAELARGRAFVANTAGFVRGPGVRLQAASLSALRPDFIVAIGEGLEPILKGRSEAAAPLGPSPMARRKSGGRRRALRQSAFAAALEGAAERIFSPAAVRFEPAPPAHLADRPERPVCALADEEDRAIGILVDAGVDGVRVIAPPGPSAETLRLGRMWAEPSAQGWRLLEKLRPSWVAEGKG